MHGRRKFASCNPAIQGGATQRGDPYHIGHAKKRGACRARQINMAVIDMGFELHDNSLKLGRAFK
jgi:hypothetical protein